MKIGTYNPAEMERRIQQFWEDEEIFTFQKDIDKPIYSIDTPPRTLSGTIHMGHAMSYSQMEFIARYKRMRGFNVFFPMGFDDNGLATERYVEQKYGVSAKDMSRDDFIELCLKETVIGGEYFRKIWTLLGISCDWSTLYSTIDEHCRRVAQKSFIDLFEMGRLERKEDPITWCPLCETAIAQAELEDKTEETLLTTIQFSCEGHSLPIATTRPEFIAACVAVVVHPKDHRYTALPGKLARVPLYGHAVPIIADEKVDMNFGTGIVMVCTFGDKTDVEWWRDHHLDTRIIITENGRLNELSGPYEGFTISEGREKILQDLEEKGLIITQEKLEHTLNAHERCHTPIEFIIVKQWFAKVLDVKEELIEKGKQVHWYPEYMGKRYESWVENLRWDWCISRQRYYGIPFPLWYCADCGTVILAREEDLPVDPVKDRPSGPCECGCTDFIPERDVLDTWFTSSHTPQIAARWGESDSLMDKVFPMNLRSQAHDIIRTWAFYTIYKAMIHHDMVPWYDAMISGHGLDEQGKAMHASVGNVVLPTEMTDKYSSDAVRYWASEAKLGEDVLFKERDVVKGYKLCVKLWNAAKLIAPHLKKISYFPPLRAVDEWILTRLDRVIQEATGYFDEYEYSRGKNLAEISFWHEFCDNYLEIVKYRLYGEKDEAVLYTLYQAYLTYLKLFSPYIAHITEELYQILYRDWEGEKSIHLSSWPEPFAIPENERGQIIVDIISTLRRWKSDQGIPLNRELPTITLYTDRDLGDLQDICGAMNISQIEISTEEPAWIEKISRVSPDFKVLGPLFGKDTPTVAKLLETHAAELEHTEELSVDGFTLKNTYISSVEKEFFAGEKKVEVLSSGDIIIEIEMEV
ncbi:MAG: valine--tRNA ligase [Theionarchaea archaeon]|nr:valine--tRNA ligase [Theionarchaea archaeon]